MSSEIVIDVKNISKCYQIYASPKDRLKQSLYSSLAEFFGLSSINFYQEFWALKDISLEVRQGETVGILGKNGSGKSTLLQIISGIIAPSGGEVKVFGRVAALLELGAGFNPEFSGRENIYMYGAILGLSNDEVSARYQEILSFADIGDFIERPVKTYSSGMFARLAFSIAINVEPSILIVDEALSVGDLRFQQKCFRKIRELQDKGVTIIFVSHDITSIKNICDRVILINNGRLVEDSVANIACNKYFEILNFTEEKLLEYSNKLPHSHIDNLNLVDLSNFPCLGDGTVKILGASIYSDKQINSSVAPGTKLTIKISFKSVVDLNQVFIGFLFKNERGVDIFGTNSLLNGGEFTLKKDVDYIYEIEFKSPHLINNKYMIDLSISCGKMLNHQHCCWMHDALSIEFYSENPKYFAHTHIGIPAEDVFNQNLYEI